MKLVHFGEVILWHFTTQGAQFPARDDRVVGLSFVLCIGHDHVFLQVLALTILDSILNASPRVKLLTIAMEAIGVHHNERALGLNGTSQDLFADTHAPGIH